MRKLTLRNRGQRLVRHSLEEPDHAEQKSNARFAGLPLNLQINRDKLYPAGEGLNVV